MNLNLFKKIKQEYPALYAVYDVGKYYGVCVEESFYLLNKDTLQTEKSLLRYELEVIKLIEKSIPIWYGEESD